MFSLTMSLDILFTSFYFFLKFFSFDSNFALSFKKFVLKKNIVNCVDVSLKTILAYVMVERCADESNEAWGDQTSRECMFDIKE